MRGLGGERNNAREGMERTEGWDGREWQAVRMMEAGKGGGLAGLASCVVGCSV